jgi:cob(I)alamin adenosyltransferase
MAEKKTNSQKLSKKAINNAKAIDEAIKTVPEMPSMTEQAETKIAEAINNMVSEVQEDVVAIKEQEAKIMQRIETNPESTPEIVSEEIKKVDNMIQAQMAKIEELTKEVKNNVVFTTTQSWNGWGYGN